MTTATVTHEIDGQRLSRACEDPRALLTSPRGDTLILGSPNASNYDGWTIVTPDGERVKVLYDLSPGAPITGLTIGDGWIARRCTTGASQRLTLTDGGMRADFTGGCTLTLDCKRRFDEDDTGRHYEVREEHGAPGADVAGLRLFTVTYEKRIQDARGGERPEYRIHLAIATTLPAHLINGWREVTYPYDARRGTHATPWVFDALRIDGDGAIAIAAGLEPRAARHAAIDLLLRRGAHQARHGAGCHAADHLGVHARLALRALAALCTEEGIVAGVPWFTQVWSRDELITAGGILAAGETREVITILDRWYRAVRPDGTLPAMHPDQGLESSDAPGWLSRRTLQLLARLDATGERLPDEQLRRWRDASERLVMTARDRLRDGLLWVGPKTTWMDTQWQDDGRAGARIEIQALGIATCDAYLTLCARTGANPAPDAAGLARTIRAAVRDRLVEGGTLLDGLAADGTPDRTVRPNLFLAWHAAPDLFSPEEWGMFFRAALPRLWLPWGALASIDTDSPLYHDRGTGEDVASYHRGDVWYFVDALAAAALYATDRVAFRTHIERLLAANVDDLLWQGIVGHASEISSAGTQEALGCHAQAWSAAALLEALSIVGDRGTFL